MRILALDTSTDACSVALLQDHEIIEESVLAPRRHAELILAMLQRILAEGGCSLQQVDAIAFGRGPGSFVGVRIATGVVQGIAYAQSLPVIPVSSLAAMAQAETAAKRILVANDARMGELYWGVYQQDTAACNQGVVQLLGEECVLPAEQVPAADTHAIPVDECIGLGTGWLAYGELLRARFPGLRTRVEVYPQAKMVARLATADLLAGRTVESFQAHPVYLRNKVTQG